MWFFHPHTWTDYCLNKYAPITNLFPKYHMSKHSRTCVKWDTNNNKKVKKWNIFDPKISEIGDDIETLLISTSIGLDNGFQLNWILFLIAFKRSINSKEDSFVRGYTQWTEVDIQHLNVVPRYAGPWWPGSYNCCMAGMTEEMKLDMETHGRIREIETWIWVSFPN